MGNAIANFRFRWPNGKIPFEVDPHLLGNTTAATAVRQAIQHWNDNTAILLSPRNGESDYVYFELDLLATNSFVGKRGGRQVINCALTSGLGFTSRSIIHEIGHAVGLYHEHQRLDRDNFVNFNLNNIQRDKLGDFAFPTDIAGNRIPSIDFGEYDFSSIMHYGRTAFAINNTIDTITCKSGACPTNMGQQPTLSPGDIQTVAGIYSVDIESLGGQNWPLAPIAITAHGNSIYIIENERLYRVDPNNGTHTPITGHEWKNPPIAMIALGDWIYIVENERVYRVNPNDGTIVPVTGHEWLRPPIAMASQDNMIYILENERLYRVDPNGGQVVPLTGHEWTRAPVAMTAHGNSIYIIENERLYRVNPSNGTFIPITGHEWLRPPIAMTALGNMIYVLENERLYRVDPNSGDITAHGDRIWRNPPYALVGMGDYLYVINNGHLYKVKP